MKRNIDISIPATAREWLTDENVGIKIGENIIRFKKNGKLGYQPFAGNYTSAKVLTSPYDEKYN